MGNRRTSDACGLLVAAAIMFAGTGCCIGYRDVSTDPKVGKNFASLLQGKCFQTVGDSVPFVGEELDPGPGTPELRRQYGTVTSGTRFRVLRLVENCGSDGGVDVQALILNGPFAARTLDVKYFFLPPHVIGEDESKRAFVIGPHAVACDPK